MQRTLSDAIKAELNRKIILLTGPRQCGKTTLAKMLVPQYQYLNHDLAEHRLLLREKSWDRRQPLVIFDELHKMPQWKRWLKGIYDVEGLPPALLVTGSARLSAFRKVGDSLAGRHFEFRLHPLDVKEAVAHTELSKADALARLLQVGGFPEPFLDGRKSFYNRWKRSHIDLILKEDLVTLTAVRDIHSIEVLIELLRSRVGSPVSVNSLARDLQKSPQTVQNWLKLLEDLYVIFRVNPYHKNIARALLQAPKYYFFDSAMVEGELGLRLENIVACALLKEIQRKIDVDGEPFDLHYIKNKDGYEIDFLVTYQKKPHQLIEVKWQDTNLSPNFKKLLADLSIPRIQVVSELAQAKSFSTGERIEDAAEFLVGYTL
jgi:uncharacterized protein